MLGSWVIENYYAEQQARMLGDFKHALQMMSRVLVARFGQAETGRLVQAALQEYEALIPHIPYVGGSANPFTKTLVEAAWFLACYRVMKADDIPTRQIGAVIQKMYAAWLHRYPRFVWRLAGWWEFTHFYTDKLVARALRSQQRRYPGDWVFTVSDDLSGGYQVNYTACGICKFYHAQGADELIPYMCSLDYLLSHSKGLKLIRRGTLAQGAPQCDFQVKKV